MKISDSLQKAKEIILERGRGSGRLLDPITGKVCLMGAIHAAEGRLISTDQIDNHDMAYRDGYSEGVDFLGKYMHDNQIPGCSSKNYVGNVYVFNDNFYKTDDAIFDILDNATIAAKEQGL